MKKHLLLTARIFKTQFIKTFPFVGLATESGLCLILWELNRWCVTTIIGTSRHDGSVDIPIQVADQYLCANARYRRKTIAISTPTHGNPHPAGGTVIGTSPTIPMKMHFH